MKHAHRFQSESVERKIYSVHKKYSLDSRDGVHITFPASVCEQHIFTHHISLFSLKKLFTHIPGHFSNTINSKVFLKNNFCDFIKKTLEKFMFMHLFNQQHKFHHNLANLYRFICCSLARYILTFSSPLFVHCGAVVESFSDGKSFSNRKSQ